MEISCRRRQRPWGPGGAGRRSRPGQRWHAAEGRCPHVPPGLVSWRPWLEDRALRQMIGDAAYTPQLYAGPDEQKLPPGQAEDRDAWATSLGRIRATEAARVHFCHHTDVIHA